MADQGFFRKFGLEPNIVRVADGSKLMGALIGGSGDIVVISGFSQALAAIEKGAKIKLVAATRFLVDDVIYFDESPFQDGAVAQAVNTVTGNGVLYFSSAGNEGNKDDGTSGTWEGDFNANGTPAALAGNGPVHNFGDGGQALHVTDAFLNTAILIWAENYDLNTGSASTDFDW